MEGIVKHLKKGDVALKTQCANALFKVCPSNKIRSKKSPKGRGILRLRNLRNLKFRLTLYAIGRARLEEDNQLFH